MNCHLIKNFHNSCGLIDKKLCLVKVNQYRNECKKLMDVFELLTWVIIVIFSSSPFNPSSKFDFISFEEGAPPF